MRRLLSLLLACFLLSGCAGEQASSPSPALTRYEATFLTLFDTVTVIKGYAQDEAAFQAIAQDIYDGLQEYHQLYDIYHEYPGMVNLKTINDAAGGPPVVVEQPILDLLLFCQEVYTETEGRVNAAMGSVLSLWHEAREAGINDPEQAALPDQAALEEAALHTDFSAVVIDEDTSTVQITDPETQLDVGAIAKGYAVEQVCREAPAGLLVSVGGNVRATGPKADGQPWVVGVQSPDGDGEDFLHTLEVSQGSVVTSGDYQRYYTVDGIRYHHIIDPSTLLPATYWRSVTIVCADSGLADALSTALFTLPLEEGQALLDRWDAQAMWVDASGQIFYSAGFSDLIRT